MTTMRRMASERLRQLPVTFSEESKGNATEGTLIFTPRKCARSTPVRFSAAKFFGLYLR